jgi:glycolate oxidase iron-sulfur subunit
MVELLPQYLPSKSEFPQFTPAQGKRRGKVALLLGCVQQVLEPEINWATIRVLSRNGVDVVIPPLQGCCGGLLLHTGEHSQARRLARQNLEAFPLDVDAILTNAAGCGSGVKEYPLLFKGEIDEEIAKRFSEKIQDISQYLVELGLVKMSSLPQPLKAAYHDACHHAHAQGITIAPRTLLRAIPNLTLLEINESTTCCGSAGTYNLDQPEIASQLGASKVLNILQCGAQAVVTGNIGCMVQIRSALNSSGKSMPVFHTIQLLDIAYSVG